MSEEMIKLKDDFNGFQQYDQPLSKDFKTKMLYYAMEYEACTYLTNNGINYPHDPFEEVLAIGIKREIDIEDKNTFDAIQQEHIQCPSWLFGFLTYDLKNELESLESTNRDILNFPKAAFYEPIHILHFKQGQVAAYSDWPVQTLIDKIDSFSLTVETENKCKEINKRVRKNDYINTVAAIKNHITEGDVYELNYCIECDLQDTSINPVETFRALNEKSPMPFAAFQKYNEHIAICASPERYIKKDGRQLICQPIKGTIKRGEDIAQDEALRQELFNNEKERAENMMIVDLVRNDLARSAKVGSVKVEEMFGIYTFQSLHQMISTIVAEIRDEEPFISAIKNSFPMGSMTGAPKIKAMELIEQYETAKRGLFSGSIGYITPSSNFDFNVIIRTILYNAALKHIQYMVGSAITIDSNELSEWNEVELKSMAIEAVLGGK